MMSLLFIKNDVIAYSFNWWTIVLVILLLLVSLGKKKNSMVALVTVILKSYAAIFSITKYKFIVRLVDSQLNNLAP